jgi:DNA-binding NtrC family response regulator
MRVLVVDDEPIVLKSCRLVIGAEGWEMISSSSVAEALSVLERITPDLLLIDVKMPVHDGMVLMRHVREKHPGIPLVVMSGYATAETVREAEGLGAAVFLPKPFTPDELADTLRLVTKGTHKT